MFKFGVGGKIRISRNKHFNYKNLYKLTMIFRK